MKPTSTLNQLIFAALGLALASAAFAQEANPAPAQPAGATAQTAAVVEQADHWSFDATPYLWVPSVETSTSLPLTPTTPAGEDRFQSKITAGALLALEARYRSVGVFVDLNWLQLDTQGANP